jgi:3-oxoacyl-[acyl-carrier-protein] synthase-3
MGPEEIGLVIVATATPDQPFPATAVQVIEDLGCVNAGGFDLSAACSGFVFGAQTAGHFVAAGAAKAVLVIGVEVLTRILDYTDRTTCVLFGDGAGAAVVTPFARAGRFEFVSESTRSIPDRDAIIQPGGGSRHPASPESIAARLHFLKMDGRRTFKQAVRTFAELLESAAAPYGGVTELGMVVPHQMNQRIMESVAERVGVPIDLFYSNVAKYGNTSAASIPIAIREAIDDGRFAEIKGKLACLCAFGAGLGYGHLLLRV